MVAVSVCHLIWRRPGQRAPAQDRGRDNGQFRREIRDRPAGAAQGRPAPAHGRRQVHRRRQPSGPAPPGVPARAHGPRHDQGHGRCRRQGGAGRGRRVLGQGPRRRRHRPCLHRRQAGGPRRQRHVPHPAPGAARRQGALCRRADRHGDRRDREPGQGRRRDDHARDRGAAGRRQRGAGARQGRPRDPRREARQSLPALGERRAGTLRRGRQDGPQDRLHRPHQQPRRAGADGAQVLHRLHGRGRPPHRLRAVPGRAPRPGRAVRHPVRRRQQQGAPRRAEHRRRLRHPLQDLSRDRGRGLRRQEARQDREMVGRPLRDLRLRPARARPGQQGRARARQGRQDPRLQDPDLRQHRRLGHRERRAPARSTAAGASSAAATPSRCSTIRARR